MSENVCLALTIKTNQAIVICDIQITQNSTQSKHNIIYLEEIQYKCTTCEMPSRKTGNLNIHFSRFLIASRIINVINILMTGNLNTIFSRLLIAQSVVIVINILMTGIQCKHIDSTQYLLHNINVCIYKHLG